MARHSSVFPIMVAIVAVLVGTVMLPTPLFAQQEGQHSTVYSEASDVFSMGAGTYSDGVAGASGVLTPPDSDSEEDGVAVASVPSTRASAAFTVNVRNYGAVGDGKTDDAQAINAALRAVEKKGTALNPAVVIVPAGTYLVKDVITVFSNTTIKADAKAVIKSSDFTHNVMVIARHRDSSGAICASEACKHGGYSQVKNITIDGGTWDRNDLKGIASSSIFTARHAANIVVKNATFMHAVDHMVNLSASTDCVVENCTFKDAVKCSQKTGSFWETDNDRIFDPYDPVSSLERHQGVEAVHFDFAAKSGELDAFPYDNTVSKDAKVLNCTFENVHAGVGSHHVSSYRGSGITVSNCSFNNILGSCIDAHSFDKFVVSDIVVNGANSAVWSIGSDVTLKGNNTVTDVALHGLRVLDKSKLTTSGTLTIDRPGTTGIMLRDGSSAALTGTITVNSPGQNGIDVVGSSSIDAQSADIVVSSPKEYGVHLDLKSACSVKKLSVASASKSGIGLFGASTLDAQNIICAKSISSGIYAQDASKLRVTGKVTIESPGDNGVFLTDGADMQVVGETVVKAAKRAGIRLDGKAKAILGAAIVESPATQGFSLSGASELTVATPTVRKSGSHGLYADGGSTMKITGKATIDSAGESGAYIAGGANLEAKGGMSITKPKKFGVRLDSSAKATLVSASVTSPGSQGLSASGGSTLAATKVDVENAVNGAGLYSEGGSTVKVSDSSFTGCKQGISLKGTNTGSFINGSTVSDTSGVAVLVQEKSAISLSDNTISSAGAQGVYVNNGSLSQLVSLTGNKVSQVGAGKAAVAIENSNVVVKDNTVSNLKKGCNGITASNKAKVVVVNNTVVGNDTGDTTGTLIQLSGCSDNSLVANNKIGPTAGIGIMVNATSNIALNGNTVTNAMGNGIQVSGSSKNVTVSGNKSVSKYRSDNDIRISSGVMTSKVENNSVGGRGVSIDRAAQATNKNNVQEGASFWTRLKGSSALDTMKVISSSAFAKSNVVVVATSGGFADALAASALAGRYNAPVLMTAPSSLSGQTRAEVARLGAKTAYVVGGRFAVSDKVMSQLKAAGCTTVTRVKGSAADDTSREIAKAVGTARSRTVIVATSLGYEDALSVSPYAYATKSPIILTNAKTGKLSAENVAWIKSAGFDRAIVVGGRFAVPTAVEDQLKGAGIAAGNIERLRGASAYDTSVAIAQWAVGNGMSANGMGVATGLAYADALAGAALCGSKGSVLLLADGKNSKVAVDFARANKATVSQGYVFGGRFAVPDSVMTNLQQATSG